MYVHSLFIDFNNADKKAYVYKINIPRTTRIYHRVSGAKRSTGQTLFINPLNKDFSSGIRELCPLVY